LGIVSERSKALWAIITCVLFWGFSFVSIKIAVPVFPPMTLGALRFALAVVFLIFIKRRLAPGERLNPRDLPYLIGAGLTGVTLYFFCENNGVSLVSASEASIIIGAIPVLTMAAEWLRERLRRPGRSRGNGGIGPTGGRRRWLGAVISVIGVVLVAGVSISLSGNILGYFYMGGAALSWVLYCFLTDPLFAGRSRIYIVFWQSFFGFLGFLPFALLEYPRWGTPDLPVLLHVGFLGICCSALGYWFNAHALEVLGVSVSAVFINLIPAVTVVAGFFILGDRLSGTQWAGAALTITGVYLAVVPGRPPPGSAGAGPRDRGDGPDPR
jgi:drug/metabolite transporter (DMT)-like permease